MRILHVLDHSIPVHTSYSHRSLSLLRQQRALGWHTVQLTGPAQGKVETEDRNRDGWHFFRTAPGPAWLPPSLLAGRIARRLCHAIRLARPDVLHAHPPALNAVAALWAGWRSGVPVLVEIHGGANGAADRYAARCAGAVVVDSFALRTRLIGGGADADRITVVAPSIDMPRHQPAMASGFGDGPVIGHVGRQDGSAGLHLLMAAVESLRPAHPGMVVVTERIKDMRMAAIMAGADLVVFPGLPTGSLAVPRKPLAAMAYGALVLASDIAPHRELVDHGRNGILFEAGSIDSLAEAMAALLAESACMQPLRERARAFAATERSWAVAARRYGPVYRRLIDGAAR